MLRALQEKTVDDRARYVRIVVRGFAQIRAALLQKIVEAMPLLHEMLLPDREWEPNLLVVLCDFVEPLAVSNPRLRSIIFKGEKIERLWE